jgi:cyclin H
MIEDDIYRTSSQYRLWSYTRDALARIRQETNELAAQRVRAAFRRARSSAQNGGPHGSGAGEGEGEGDAAASVAAGEDGAAIDTLTVEEELKIVEWGCSKIVDMGEAMNPRIPSHVVVSVLCLCGSFFCVLVLADDHGRYNRPFSPILVPKGPVRIRTKRLIYLRYATPCLLSL